MLLMMMNKDGGGDDRFDYDNNDCDDDYNDVEKDEVHCDECDNNDNNGGMLDDDAK